MRGALQCTHPRGLRAARTRVHECSRPLSSVVPRATCHDPRVREFTVKRSILFTFPFTCKFHCECLISQYTSEQGLFAFRFSPGQIAAQAKRGRVRRSAEYQCAHVQPPPTPTTTGHHPATTRTVWIRRMGSLSASFPSDSPHAGRSLRISGPRDPTGVSASVWQVQRGGSGV